MKKKFTKSLLALSLLTSSSVMASGQPTFDLSNYIENITGNISEIESRITSAKEFFASRKLSFDLFSTKESAEAAKQAQEIKESQKLARRVRNTQVAAEMLPLPDACKTVARSKLRETVGQDCAIQDSLADSLERQAALDLASFPELSEDGSLALPNMAIKRKEDLERTVNKCRVELLSGPISVGESPESKSTCLKIDLLLNNDITTITTGKEVEGAKELINILVGSTYSKVDPDIITASTTMNGKTALMKEYRKVGMRNISRSVLNNILEQRHPAFWLDDEKTQPSASNITQLEQFNAERFAHKNGEWMLKVSGLHPEKLNSDPDVARNSIYTPDQVLRDMAIMDSFMVHMEILQYKSQLRIESMQAALLSLEIDPLED
jgi:hypothetical protein